MPGFQEDRLRAMVWTPEGMPAPPSYNKSNPTDMPVLFLTLTSDTLPLAQVNRYAEDDVDETACLTHAAGFSPVSERVASLRT